MISIRPTTDGPAGPPSTPPPEPEALARALLRRAATDADPLPLIRAAELLLSRWRTTP